MAYGTRWLGHRRIDYTIQCGCIIETEGGVRSPNSKCSRCMGVGYPFTDQLIKGYFWKGFFTGNEFPAEVGRLSVQGRNLVTPHNRPVNKFDHILVLDLDPDTGEPRQPFAIMQTYIVVDVIGLIGEDGSIQFWRSTLQERSTDDGLPGNHGTSYAHRSNLS